MSAGVCSPGRIVLGFPYFVAFTAPQPNHMIKLKHILSSGEKRGRQENQQALGAKKHQLG
jgi:hypothetical protein